MNNELYHYGVLGMKWGRRKDKQPGYRSTSLKSAAARRANKKVDKSFENWNDNAKKRDNAIELGKKANLAKMAYEKNKSDKGLRTASKQATKDYKKALASNTTYRKGVVRKEVGSDLSRKYLSEAKKVKKQLVNDPNNKELQKKYNDFMSKHDVERAKARKATSVASKRSQKKASFKRGLTMTVKSAATTAGIAAGVYAVNRYMTKHDVRLDGVPIRVNADKFKGVFEVVNKGKNFMKYFY